MADRSAGGIAGDGAWLLVPTDEIGAGGGVRVASGAGDGSTFEVRLVPGRPARRSAAQGQRP